ncbi:MAG: homoserine O-acetyltransferase [Actinobacteria bacterium]|nr:homoserine O-acetyltransferase [Actinomycetota bacterium]
MTTPDQRAPLSREPLPVTGAWRAGDAVGQRRFVRVATTSRFQLEGGSALRDVDIAFETWGRLDDQRANAVLVCHALTGDSHASGRAGVGHPTAGWWDGLIGPGRALDTDRYFMVCANVLGGCQGTTGPAALEPQTGEPYGSRFPVVSIRDMVRAQAELADRLGIGAWLSVVGGSMGGMQVLEWAVMFPDRVRSIVPIATVAAATAQQIGYSMVQRSAIELDPKWRGGDYYGAEPGDGPARGLANARALAQITYRSDEVFGERFGRNVVDGLDQFRLWQRFDVEGYLDYHGAKLVRRFDANTYLVICKAMDLHDVGRGRGGVATALGRIRCPAHTMSITTDALYYPYQQELIRDELRSRGLPVEHTVIDSPHGHDAFLLETEQIGGPLTKFLAAVV